MFSELQFIVD